MFKACLSNDSSIDVFIVCDSFHDDRVNGIPEFTFCRRIVNSLCQKDTYFHVSISNVKYIKDLKKGVFVYER